MNIRNAFRRISFLMIICIVFFSFDIIGMFRTTKDQQKLGLKRFNRLKILKNQNTPEVKKPSRIPFRFIKSKDNKENNVRIQSGELFRERAISEKLGLGKFKPQEQKNLNIVWLNAKDGTMPIEAWKASQMQGLKLLLTDQKAKGEVNSKDNPIQVRPLTTKQILLLSHAFDAMLNNKFTEYYEDLKNESYEGTGFRLTDLDAALDIVQANDLHRLIFSFDKDPHIEVVQQIGLFKPWLKHHVNIAQDINISTVSPNGSIAVNIDNNKMLSVIDIKKETIKTNNNRIPPVMDSCLLNSDGSFLAYLISNWRLFLWDVNNHKAVSLPNPDIEDVVSIAFSPNGDQLCELAQKEIRIINVANGNTEFVGSLPHINNETELIMNSGIAWSSNVQYVVLNVTVYTDTKKSTFTMLYILDIKKKQITTLFNSAIKYAPWAILISPDNTKCAYLTQNDIVIYDIKKEKKLYTIAKNQYFTTDSFNQYYVYGSIAFDKNSTYCFIDQARKGAVLRINMENGDSSIVSLEEQELGITNHKITNTALNTDGSVLAVVSASDLILYNTATGIKITSFAVENVLSISFNITGDKLTVVSKNSIDQYDLYSPNNDMNINTKIEAYRNKLQQLIEQQPAAQPTAQAQENWFE